MAREGRRRAPALAEVGGGSIIATEEEARARPMSCGRGLAFSRFRIMPLTTARPAIRGRRGASCCRRG
ncbi:hypothetical protein AB5I41_08670 [Sphingomonas sp. MMS24-JH45]